MDSLKKQNINEVEGGDDGQVIEAVTACRGPSEKAVCASATAPSSAVANKKETGLLLQKLGLGDCQVTLTRQVKEAKGAARPRPATTTTASESAISSCSDGEESESKFFTPPSRSKRTPPPLRRKNDVESSSIYCTTSNDEAPKTSSKESFRRGSPELAKAAVRSNDAEATARRMSPLLAETRVKDIDEKITQGLDELMRDNEALVSYLESNKNINRESRATYSRCAALIAKLSKVWRERRVLKDAFSGGAGRASPKKPKVTAGTQTEATMKAAGQRCTVVSVETLMPPPRDYRATVKRKRSSPTPGTAPAAQKVRRRGQEDPYLTDASTGVEELGRRSPVVANRTLAKRKPPAGTPLAAPRTNKMEVEVPPPATTDDEWRVQGPRRRRRPHTKEAPKAGEAVPAMSDMPKVAPKPAPRRLPKYRGPRNEAVYVKAPEGKTYAEVFRTVAEKVKTGLESVKTVRKSRTGDLIIEIAKEGNAPATTEAIKAVMGEGVSVKTLSPKMDIEVTNLDPIATEGDVVEALAALCGSANSGDARVKIIRTAYRGTRTAIVEVPRRWNAGGKLADGAKAKIGFTVCNVREVLRTLRCFRCHEQGHIGANCPNVKDRETVICRRCGQAGHVQKGCTLPPSCYVCRTKGRPEAQLKHVAGASACPEFKEYLRRSRQHRSA